MFTRGVTQKVTRTPWWWKVSPVSHTIQTPFFCHDYQQKHPSQVTRLIHLCGTLQSHPIQWTRSILHTISYIMKLFLLQIKAPFIHPFPTGMPILSRKCLQIKHSIWRQVWEQSLIRGFYVVSIWLYSPEQRELTLYSTSSDIYSAGLILLELLLYVVMNPTDE